MEQLPPGLAVALSQVPCQLLLSWAWQSWPHWVIPGHWIRLGLWGLLHLQPQELGARTQIKGPLPTSPSWGSPT
jgi:hypothetical protein